MYASFGTELLKLAVPTVQRIAEMFFFFIFLDLRSCSVFYLMDKIQFSCNINIQLSHQLLQSVLKAVQVAVWEYSVFNFLRCLQADYLFTYLFSDSDSSYDILNLSELRILSFRMLPVMHLKILHFYESLALLHHL